MYRVNVFLIFQDMEHLGCTMINHHQKPSFGRLCFENIFPNILVVQDKSQEWPLWAKQQFRKELQEMVDCLHNHPSVMVWIPFNEAWGQHDTLEIAEWLKSYDPSRLVNIASGGNFFEVGDIVDHHNYPEADFPLGDVRFENFIKVIGEFGGHGLVLPEEHLWQTSRKNWGYDVLKELRMFWVVRCLNSEAPPSQRQWQVKVYKDPHAKNVLIPQKC